MTTPTQTLQVEEPTFIAEWNRSEIESQISTAKKFPRDLTAGKARAIELATMDDETSRECMYALQRGKGTGAKKIEGASIRLAEIMVSCFGNCRAGARVVDETAKFVTAQGVFADLETNVVITQEVRRRITNKEGKRYNDDMIGVTANAACSIALRNAILRGIPKAVWSPVYAAARAKAIGKASGTINERRQNMFIHFQKMGITENHILKFMGANTPDEISDEDLVHLHGLENAIHSGEMSVDDFTGNGGPAGAGGKMTQAEFSDGKKQTKGKNGSK